MQARLALAKAARIVVANALGVLGISAPERM
jgi:arginyl-tRNA synthetase